MNTTLECRQGYSREKAGTQRVRTRRSCQFAKEWREERQLCRIDAHNFV